MRQITRQTIAIIGILAHGALLLGCGDESRPIRRLPASQDDGSGHTAASEFTAEANASVLGQLPFDDQTDFEDARRGLIARRADPIIRDAKGDEVWNLEKFAFEAGVSPDSVNPSLWRQAQLNNIHGLFRVSDRIYQVRGYDLANTTLIEGDHGWIVIDAMTTKETAGAAMDLVREHLGERPIEALIYTHSHIDHFGGVRGILSEEDLARGVPIIAPEGFLEEAVSENVLAGTAMTRRASYMFGYLIGRGPRLHVDSGLGKASALGSFGLIPPTEIISETPTEMTIDGVRMIFQNTPGAEAPAEMMIYLPDWKALCGAENVSHVLHNVYTLRGAKVRDALAWSNYIQESIDLFGDVEVIFASHHWPTWGNDRVIEYLKKQRDVYKYIHDQTLRLANLGHTPAEIAERLVLPKSLSDTFAVRGYYGTVRHNSKAVYQHYFGWFDGNPAHLDPLPAEESAPRYVEAMGGAEAILKRAGTAYGLGEYRWVATLLNHLVFAEPGNESARSLLADTYDQLGYRAESGPWRDFYLSGAKELRQGIGEFPIDQGSAGVEVVAAMPTGLFFDALAVRMNGPKAEGKHTLINFVFEDIGETHVVEIENSVLHHRLAEPREDADATMKIDRASWDEIVTGRATFQQKLLSGAIDIDGSRLALIGFFASLDAFDPAFDIVTP